MRDPWTSVNTSPQPSLFRLTASAVTLQALIDRAEGTVVLAVQTIDPISGELNALWSTGPIRIDDYEDAACAADREFFSQLWDAAGPFA